MDEALDPLVDAREAERLRAALAVEAAGIGTFDWDLLTGELDWDERLVDLFAYDAASFDRSIDSFTSRLHPEDGARVAEEMRKAIAHCGEFSSLYRVCPPDGATRLVSARGRVLCDPDGRATRFLGAAYDITGQRGGDLGVVRVLEAMPAGFYSLDPEWRFSYVNAAAERLLGRTRDDLLGQVIWEAFPATVGSVFEDSYRGAVSSGLPIRFDAHYPAPLNGWYEVRAWPSPDGVSVYFLEVTDRRQAQEQAQQAAARSALLAHVSRELAGSLTDEVATQRLPRRVVPVLADGCIVTVLDDRGQPQRVGSWHRDATVGSLLGRYARARHDVLPTLPAVARAFETGEPVLLHGSEAAAVMPPGEARDLMTRLAPGTVVSLPLRGRGRNLGLLTLLYSPGREPSAEDLSTAEDLADRTGLALDNARLYGEQRQLAEALQRSMLTAPPQPDHGEIVVRYLPAAEAAAVGGDWYDAFMQRDGATMLVIGDVVGHDTAAAATMGQLRSMLRAIATSTGGGPAGVLTSLDQSLSLLEVGTMATAMVARFEQTPQERRDGVARMRWANAGHLPPVAVHADGTVATLSGWRSELLLGVDPDVTRSEAVVELDRGATVLLYTDGLVERRNADLDTGLARLSAALADLADLPLPELCDRLIERLVDGRPDDDVALVAIRLHRQDRPRPVEAGIGHVPEGVPPEPPVPA